MPGGLLGLSFPAGQWEGLGSSVSVSTCLGASGAGWTRTVESPGNAGFDGGGAGKHLPKKINDISL